MLQPKALYESVADRIRDQILNHQLKPGQDIHELNLVTSLGVSRTPIREALKLLQHEGLLTADPRRGMHVTQLSEAEIKEAEALHQLLGDFAKVYCEAQANDLQDCYLLKKMMEMAKHRLQLANH